MEAQGRAARVPFGCRAVGRAVERDDQAFEAAPGIAHAEQGQPVQHRRDRIRRAPGCRTTENRPEEPGKSRFQISCPGAAREAGEAPAYLRPRRQPGGEAERLLLVLLQPERHGAKAAQCQEHVLGAGADGHGIVGHRAAPAKQRSFAETSPSRRSEPPRRYFVPASMHRSTPSLCGGKKSGVAQVLSMSTTAPCRCAAAAMAGTSCISKVCEPGASVKTAVVFGRIRLCDPSADQRVVIGRLDPEALEHAVAENPRGQVGRIGDQQMIA